MAEDRTNLHQQMYTMEKVEMDRPYFRKQPYIARQTQRGRPVHT